MLRFALITLVACSSGDEDTETADGEDVTPGAVVIDPTSIDVGQLDLHEQASSAFEITNAGEGDLQVYDVQFQDDSLRAHWTLEGGLSGMLAPGDSTIITVVAHPQDIDDINGQLTVLTDDPGDPEVSVQLRGEVTGEPEVRLDPTTALDLGSVLVGESSTDMVHIANDGTADLDISSVAFGSDSGPFTLTVDPTGTSVRPQSEDGMASVTFAPTSVGAFTDALIITTNDPDTPTTTVAITGIGYED